MAKSWNRFVPGGLPHWVQTAFYFLLFGILAIILLSGLARMKEAAEREAVALTIRNIESGMRMNVVELLLTQKESEVSAWAGANPVRWLVAPPTGYLGECSASAALALEGNQWCFDREKWELVYHLAEPAHLQSPIGRSAPCEDMRWRVSLTDDSALGGMVGARLESVDQCRWVLSDE